MTPGRPVAQPPPLYEQVKRHILDLMARGSLAHGAKLPSEHALMVDLGVSRMTIHRAMRELSADGYISRHQGIGSFAAAPRSRVESVEIHDIVDDIAARGGAHAATVVAHCRVSADVEQAALFDCAPGTDLFQSVVVHREDGIGVLLEERLVSVAFAPGYLDIDLRTFSAARYLQGISPPEEVEHRVMAGRPSRVACDLLEIAPGEPCLKLIRRGRRRGSAVTHALLTYPGTRGSLGLRGNDRSAPPWR